MATSWWICVHVSASYESQHLVILFLFLLVFIRWLNWELSTLRLFVDEVYVYIVEAFV